MQYLGTQETLAQEIVILVAAKVHSSLNGNFLTREVKEGKCLTRQNRKFMLKQVKSLKNKARVQNFVQVGSATP
jgi:hypothetical protein